MNELEKIKEKIHTVNPEITDELLDLLYEYVMTRYKKDVEYSLSHLPVHREISSYSASIAKNNAKPSECH